MEKPTLTAYALAPDVPALVPAIPERNWMELGDRRAYRCLPLSIANSSGWEYRSPISFCTAPGILDTRLHYAARLRVVSRRAARASSGLR
jgi:hypothetical protein